MVGDSNTAKILGVDYVNRAHPTLGIEPLSLSDLLARVPPGHFAQPQRPNFHLLILVVSGGGTHFLDFERIACQPGTLLHVRPGQVQQFGRDQGLQAEVLLFTPESVLPETGIGEFLWFGALIDNVLPQGAGCLEERDLGYLRQTFDALDLEYRGTDGSLVSARTLQHLLHALLFQIMRYTRVLDAPQIKQSYRLTCRRFLKELDARFIESRNVGDYAEELGCTVKTLRRACLATRGVPPKALIEQRVVLEAKRLLAHTDLPVEAVAVSVGFTEPTNFVKFFRGHAGMLPSKFGLLFLASRRGLGGDRGCYCGLRLSQVRVTNCPSTALNAWPLLLCKLTRAENPKSQSSTVLHEISRLPSGARQASKTRAGYLLADLNSRLGTRVNSP